jgi:predicted esterase
MIRSKQIKVEKTARYYTLGTNDSNIKNVWLVCHGYGQLARYFINKFKVLADDKTLIIAPEALNKFYLNGFSGRVGATWMTKEARELDIDDYCLYLDRTYNELSQEVDFSHVRFSVLGFSQGTATVCRWLAHSGIKVHQLVLWAGIFPPDLNTDFEFSIKNFLENKITIVYGLEDPMLKQEHHEQMQAMKSIKPDLEILTFKGGHDIDSDTLLKIAHG